MASQKIKIGSVSLTVYPWTHSSGQTHWRFGWYDRDGSRRFTTRKEKKEAVQAARSRAKEIHNAGIDLTNISDEQARLCRAFLDLKPDWAGIELLRQHQLQKTVTTNFAFDRYIELKKANAGRSPHHVKTLTKRIEPLIESFPETALSSITAAQLDDWLLSRDKWAASTRKKARSEIVSFFSWAQKQGWLAPGPTAASAMAVPIVSQGPPTTWTPKEIHKMIEAVRPEYLPWLTLTAFAGIRREELYPAPTSKKSALCWEDIRWSEKIIVVPADVSKTGKKRIIEIRPILKKLLKKNAGKGKVCQGIPPEKVNHGQKSETARLGEIVGGWKANANRHSFISYRASQVGSATAASEAGNSESMTRSTYLDLKTKKDASAYFSENL